MKKISVLMSAALMAMLCMPVPAGAQVKVDDRFGDWVFKCVALAQAKTACALTYTIVSKRDNRGIVQLSLGYNEKKGGMLLTAFLPLGIHLPSGVNGSIDQGKPFQYTVETCLQRGCIATYAVSSEFLKALQSGKQLNIGFAAGDGPKQISLGAALNGLAEGLKAAKLN